MKKNLFYLLFFLLFLVFFSIFFTGKEEKKGDKKQILSTTVMIDSLVKDIVKENFEVHLLIEGETDPHSYQMKKGDKEKLEYADLVFANGLSLEHNPSLLYLLHDKKAIFLGDQILQSNPEWIISNNREIDPHIWMDLSIMQKVSDMICRSVSDLDPDNREFYIENTKVLKAKMEALDGEILTLMESVPSERRYLVSSHDAFNYFVRRYFKEAPEERLFSMQGLSTESEVSLKRISQVIEFIKEHDVRAVFYESNLPKDSIWKMMEICKSYRMKVKVSPDPLYGDTLGGMTYLEMIKHDAYVIAKNLKESL